MNYRGLKALRAFAFGVVLSGLSVACNEASQVAKTIAPEAEAVSVSAGKGSQVTADESRLINAQITLLAQATASAVADVQVATWLHKKALEKFDGETDVLWKDASGDASGIWLNKVMPKVKSSGALSSPTSLEKAIDRMSEVLGGNLHLYWHNAEKWDGKTAPLVAYTPLDEGTGQRKAEAIAVDAQGKITVLTEESVKGQPVIVLTRNERTDKNGQVRGQGLPTGGKSSARTQSSTFRIDYVRIGSIGYWDEWWFDGGPEFKGFVIGQNVQSNTTELVVGQPLWLIIPLANCNNVTYSLPNVPQMYWDTDKYPQIFIRWVEDDGGWNISEVVDVPWGGSYTISSGLYGTDDFNGNLLKTWYSHVMPPNSGMYRESSNGLMMTAATW